MIKFEPRALRSRKLPLNKVFALDGNFVCGICRSNHHNYEEAIRCLDRCWPTYINQSLVIQKRRTLGQNNVFHCRLCFQSYVNSQDAWLCATSCRKRIIKKRDLESTLFLEQGSVFGYGRGKPEPYPVSRPLYDNRDSLKGPVQKERFDRHAETSVLPNKPVRQITKKKAVIADGITGFTDFISDIPPKNRESVSIDFVTESTTEDTITKDVPSNQSITGFGLFPELVIEEITSKNLPPIKEIGGIALIPEPVIEGESVDFRGHKSSHLDILSKNGACTKKSLKLDMDLIRIREDETALVKNMLNKIYSDSDENEQLLNQTETLPNSIENPPVKLDSAHLDLVNRLIRQETWERPTLQSICIDLKLMLDGAIEVINEWAISISNTPLITGDCPFYIDINLAEEIICGQ